MSRHFNYSEDDLSDLLNKSKEITASMMVDAGLISREEADEFVKQYALMLAAPTALGKAMGKFLNFLDKNGKPTSEQINIVKVKVYPGS